MPLTHDMGLIGFHIIMFANRVHMNLMPTELFVRRPLLWLQIAAQQRATILCSPNFGYRHFLKVLGDRSPGNLDLSSVRLIFNGAEPISVELCEEFLARLDGLGLQAQFHVPGVWPGRGLAGRQLSAAWGVHCAPSSSTGTRSASATRPKSWPMPVAMRWDWSAWARSIPLCDLRIAGNDDTPLADGHVGHIHIRGENVTAGYFEEPTANAETFTADGWLQTGDLGLIHGRRDLHHRSRQGDPVRQRPELLPARSREPSRSARRRHGARQGRGGRRASAGRRNRSTDRVRAVSRRPGGVSCHWPTQVHAPGQRARGPGSGAGGAGQAHPEDHQRQDPASPAGAEPT